MRNGYAIASSLLVYFNFKNISFLLYEKFKRIINVLVIVAICVSAYYLFDRFSSHYYDLIIKTLFLPVRIVFLVISPFPWYQFMYTDHAQEFILANIYGSYYSLSILIFLTMRVVNYRSIESKEIGILVYLAIMLILASVAPGKQSVYLHIFIPVALMLLRNRQDIKKLFHSFLISALFFYIVHIVYFIFGFEGNMGLTKVLPY